MSAPPGVVAALDALSRELYLVVDEDGRVTWADARAARFGLAPGEAFPARCLAGSEEKAAELCRRGARDLVRGWELAWVVDGAPTTIAFSARPVAGGVALVGSVVPQGYANAAAEAARSFHEIVELNRELARRKSRSRARSSAARRAAASACRSPGSSPRASAAGSSSRARRARARRSR